MEIKHSKKEDGGTFFIEEDAEHLAQLVYVMKEPKIMRIDHTEVSEKLKGKGAGKQLVTKAVEFARAEKIKIYPLCSFAKSVLERTPEYADVLS